jgi:hypothetical protein
LEHKPRISIVIGVQGAHANIGEILAALKAPVEDEVEVLLCAPRNDPIDPCHLNISSVRLVEGGDDALIPELWRDGIVAARGDKIATLTAHCIPNKDWMKVVASLDMSLCAAYGGVIALSSGANAVDAAIHLLRYAGVSPPQTAREMDDLAADNAVYHRDDILACGDLLPLGFWEPSYHARFRRAGRRMAMQPDLICTHKNNYTPAEFMAQRRRHGRVFGRMRGQRQPHIKRVIMLLLSPLSFFIFGAKLTYKITRTPALRSDLLRALLWLAVFLANWSWGECRGYADTIFGPYRTAP